MSASSRKARQRNPSDDTLRQARPEAGEAKPAIRPDPRRPNRFLLALATVLFGVWFILLLLLALYA